MTIMIVLKISLVIFMAGNLLEMGLKLNPKDALQGLRDVRFVMYTLVWGFIIGPALAYAITRIIPLQPPYALGLIFMGMAPSAPFLPALAERAKGDLGYTAAFMLIVSIVTIIFMPLAVPLLAKGITVSAWTIARPLIVVILLPMGIGMLILRWNQHRAKKMSPVVRKITGVFTVASVILTAVVYGKGFIGIAGSFAVISQVIFFTILSAGAYWLSVGLKYEQKIVISIGMSTRNLGAAMAPLFSIATIDERAMVMVILGFPIMVIFALLATKVFGRYAVKADIDIAHSSNGTSTNSE